MILNGIDLAGLAEHAPSKPAYPKQVPGRVVHIDADFLAYQMSYEKPDDPKTLDDMYHNLEVAIETLTGLAGAERSVLHLTPKGSTKGGRYEIAVQKEYQGNRKDKEKPRYLHLIRQHMAEKLGAIRHMDQEADDGMSAAQYAALARGEKNLSIIATKDKDLNMVPGLHLVWDTGRIIDAPAFGSLELDAGKLKGYGSIWFWAQLLMGDTADNIQGLPLVAPVILNRIDPTVEIAKAKETLETDPDNEKALAKLAERKPKSCGPAMVYKMLGKLKNDAQCFAMVKLAFEQLEKWGWQYTKWDNAAHIIPWNHALRSEMQLLWMRRKPDPDDVFHWVAEVTK